MKTNKKRGLREQKETTSPLSLLVSNGKDFEWIGRLTSQHISQFSQSETRSGLTFLSTETSRDTGTHQVEGTIRMTLKE